MQVRRRLAAILAADVVGYSRLMGRNEVETLRQVKSLLQEVIRPLVSEHKGRVVKTTGDGVLAQFGSVFEAFECALKVQKATVERAAGVAADDRIRLRIGINVGDIIIDEGDVFGDGVNIAARLESLAKPGGICISQRAWEDLRRLKAPFVDLGDLNLKNIAQPVRAYGYVVPGAEEEARPAIARGEPPTPAKGEPGGEAHVPVRIIAAGGVVALVAAIIAVVLMRQPQAPASAAPPQPDASGYVSAQAAKMPCSWLRVSDRSSVDGYVAVKLSGAALSAPADISRTLIQSAKAAGVGVDEVNTSAVAPLYRSQCAWIDKLRGLRYGGVPRYTLTPTRKARGVTRVALTLEPRALGAAGAVYGVEPSGKVERIVDAGELAALGPPAVVRRTDGGVTLNIDIDHVGWNGFVFLESKTPPPEGLVEETDPSPADLQRFEDLARAGAWRFELAWFKVDP